MIKAIIFDYFKTITFKSELGVWRQYDPNRVHEDKIKALIDQYDKGQSFSWFCQEISKVNGVPADKLEQTYFSQPEIIWNAELIDFIQNELKSKYKISLLSNVGSEPGQLVKINQLPFDDILLSFEVGMAKPDLTIYRLATKRLGVKPEECVFVDDLLENVEAAESIGMKGIVFKDYIDFLTDLNKILENTNADNKKEDI